MSKITYIGVKNAQGQVEARKVKNVWIKQGGVLREKVIPKIKITGLIKECMSYLQPFCVVGAGSNPMYAITIGDDIKTLWSHDRVITTLPCNDKDAIYFSHGGYGKKITWDRNIIYELSGNLPLNPYLYVDGNYLYIVEYPQGRVLARNKNTGGSVNSLYTGSGNSMGVGTFVADPVNKQLYCIRDTADRVLVYGYPPDMAKIKEVVTSVYTSYGAAISDNCQYIAIGGNNRLCVYALPGFGEVYSAGHDSTIRYNKIIWEGDSAFYVVVNALGSSPYSLRKYSRAGSLLWQRSVPYFHDFALDADGTILIRADSNILKVTKDNGLIATMNVDNNNYFYYFANDWGY